MRTSAEAEAARARTRAMERIIDEAMRDVTTLVQRRSVSPPGTPARQLAYLADRRGKVKIASRDSPTPLQFLAMKSSVSATRRLVIHLDLNRTILMSDAAGGRGMRETLVYSLASTAWGVMSKGPAGELQVRYEALAAAGRNAPA